MHHYEIVATLVQHNYVGAQSNQFFLSFEFSTLFEKNQLETMNKKLKIEHCEVNYLHGGK